MAFSQLASKKYIFVSVKNKSGDKQNEETRPETLGPQEDHYNPPLALGLIIIKTSVNTCLDTQKMYSSFNEYTNKCLQMNVFSSCVHYNKNMYTCT